MKSYIEHSELIHGNQTDYKMVGKVSAESVRKHTGKNWKQWITVLKNAGANSWNYQEIVQYLKAKHRLTSWWQHGVAYGFEVATGRRKAGQDAKGKYMVTATKTVASNVKNLWKLLLSKKGQDVWLKPYSTLKIKSAVQFETTDGYFGEIRTISENRRLRLYWQDPNWEKHTVTEIHVVGRTAKKSILVFNHTGIADTKTREILRSRWRKVADEIAALV